LVRANNPLLPPTPVADVVAIGFGCDDEDEGEGAPEFLNAVKDVVGGMPLLKWRDAGMLL
jgi:hypothetical protein